MTHSVTFAGYAFVFMRDSRDGDDAIHKLDGYVTVCNVAAYCYPELLHLHCCLRIVASALLHLHCCICIVAMWTCSVGFQDGVWEAEAAIESRVG